VNWHLSTQISLELSKFESLGLLERVFIKDLFENERRKGKFSSMKRLGQ